MNVYVYRTDISSEYDLEAVDELLSQEQTIVGWHVDREDVDKVLRVESTADSAECVQVALSKAGFFCEELQD
jgi:hypothetical protein